MNIVNIVIATHIKCSSKEPVLPIMKPNGIFINTISTTKPIIKAAKIVAMQNMYWRLIARVIGEISFFINNSSTYFNQYLFYTLYQYRLILLRPRQYQHKKHYPFLQNLMHCSCD